MARQWSDPVVMALLGLLSIGVVLGMNEVFKTPDHDRIGPRQDLTDEVRRVKDDFEGQSRTTARRLGDLESTVRELHQRIEALERTAAPQPLRLSLQPSPESSLNSIKESGPSGLVDEAIARGREYAANNRFDPKEHDKVLSHLVTAYSIRGLSPEENRSLQATIQQVNEIGLLEVIRSAHSLPSTEGMDRLQAFLKSTPALTPEQLHQIKVALASLDRHRPSQ